jgi:hypothetical protein
VNKLVQLRVLCFFMTLIIVLMPYGFISGWSFDPEEKIVLAIVFFVVYKYLYKKNKRALQCSESIESINELEKKIAGGNYVVLLRTFLSDNEYRKYENVSFNPFQPISLFFEDPLTLEEEVVWAFHTHGYRSMAIGNPANSILYLGATRFFINDKNSDWTVYVKAIIHSCTFICLMGYGSQGLGREVEYCLTANLQRPILIFFPGERKRLEGFKMFYKKFGLDKLDCKVNNSVIGGVIYIKGDVIRVLNFSKNYFGGSRHYVCGYVNRLLLEEGLVKSKYAKSEVKRGIIANCIDLLISIAGSYGIWLIEMEDETMKLFLCAAFFAFAIGDGLYAGWSVGKRLMKISILDKDAIKPTSGQLYTRFFFKLLFIFLFPFTVLYAIKNRRLVFAHDYISGTGKFVKIANETPRTEPGGFIR